MNHTKTQIREKQPRFSSKNTDVLHLILEEIRLLRNELHLVVPHEDLEGYAHPQRVKRSYVRAVKHYPPISAWK